jgi:hypothetical protein
MRTIKGTKTVEVTIYGCDHCEYQTDTPSNLRYHVGDKHSYLDRREIDGATWSYIPNEAAHEAIRGEWNDGRWDGPGWYTFTDMVDYHSLNSTMAEQARLQANIDSLEEEIERYRARIAKLVEIAALTPNQDPK